jgi:hypothetical protein
MRRTMYSQRIVEKVFKRQQTRNRNRNHKITLRVYTKKNRKHNPIPTQPVNYSRNSRKSIKSKTSSHPSPTSAQTDQKADYKLKCL